MTILAKKKSSNAKERRGENPATSEVDNHGQNEHNAGGSALPNSSYQSTVDRRDEESSSSNHNKRHRSRASPHRGCIGRSSRSKRERDRERNCICNGNVVTSNGERERDRDHERQSTPPAPINNGGMQGADGTAISNNRSSISNTSQSLDELATGYNSGDEYTGQSGKSLTLAEWQERDRWFEKRLGKMGFIIKQMGEDGACLFRAVADQVYGDQEMHGIVRKHCMDYITSNQEFFSHFVAEDFSTYVDRKRQEYVHGNHIEMQAMSEMYNRSVELFCYSTEPINIFHGVMKSDNEPIRLSYQRNSHYNSIVDPYKATIGVGLGLPAYNPGAADRALVSDAVRQSEDLHIEQTMLEDKIKATDWEATNEAIEEQVARESYLQWLRDNEMRKARSSSSSSSSTVTSAQNNNHFHPHVNRVSQQRNHLPPTTMANAGNQDSLRISPKVNDNVRYNKRSPQHQSTCGTVAHTNEIESKLISSQEPIPGSSKGTLATPDIPLFNRLPPEVFGLTDWEDSDILSRVLAASQQEYLDNLKQTRTSENDSVESTDDVNC